MIPGALRIWLGRKLEIDPKSIARAEIYESYGYPAYSEWTPGEGWSFVVIYEFKHKGSDPNPPEKGSIEIHELDAGEFVEQLAAIIQEIK